ncbi:hypothetical protein QCE73_33790 [Caballeronia sp. LZ029]|uniref:hypothetical protein n=1 Tax=Caballeronia sp. LZ029 TaxID=3038564 RepID=UPI0026A08A79|nr:hypothetical protein [Caballeronia sp. LZ029]MDR5748166.1 hypothetical protein [Caballeronia sp. LZ029]
MNAPRTALHGQNTTITGTLYVAFELGDRSWKLSLGDGVRAPSRYTVAAGDTAAVFTAIAKVKVRCHLAAEAPVRSCYEAGRDGFWLHRCLEEHSDHEPGGGLGQYRSEPAQAPRQDRPSRQRQTAVDADALLRG